jgi:predicted nucleotidyltransferase
MSIFDKGLDPEIFESYKRETATKIALLEAAIKDKITDTEQAALDALTRITTIEKNTIAKDTSIKDALTILEECRKEATAGLEKVKTVGASVEKSHAEQSAMVGQCNELMTGVVALKATASEHVTGILNDYEVIKKALAQSAELPTQVLAATKLLEESTTLNESIKNLLTHSMKRKSEIDELHVKAFGADVKNSAGETSHVDGLVDELERTYDSLVNRTESLDAALQQAVKDITEKHDEQLGRDKAEFDALLAKSTDSIGAITDQITGLLPGAMAEGLSAAYEKKKEDEIESQSKHEFSFRVAIGLMVAVSLIPFCVDVYLLVGKDFDILRVINNTPSIIVSILPLYFPVLWLAYSSNKKLNLSKRLIEEYTHKAVLGKTFSGLSNQIESLPHESSVRDDLRTKLLFNLLQVSSENPGKLITDYNKSDHPLMEALENSAKLSDSMEALAKIPGFSAISKSVTARVESALSKEATKVEEGLETMTKLEKAPAEAAKV